MNNARKQFCALVDGLSLPKQADAVVVLRNWDVRMSKERIDLGLKVMRDLEAGLMLMSWDQHTKAEARRFFNLAMENGWKSLLLVTHRWHSYRAMLTFIREFSGSGIRLYIASVPGSLFEPFENDEINKTEIYQEKGDVATYEEGITYLTNQTGSESS